MTKGTRQTVNERLRYERVRRGWSQQDVADKVGTTPLTISRWERGETTPGPHFRLKLSEVFEKSPYELGLSAERSFTANLSQPSLVPDKTTPASESHAPLWNVPYGRNSFFTGREEVLEQLHAALSARAHPTAISQPQAISGLGGIGKTQLAVEYAYRYRDDYQAVLWAKAESTDLLVSDYLAIAALLNLSECNRQEQWTIVNAVLRWFDTHEDWLLILENRSSIQATF
jgi:transcriptional regulator with XRE-family HTH domain